MERISLKYPQIFRKRYQPWHPIRYIRAMVSDALSIWHNEREKTSGKIYFLRRFNMVYGKQAVCRTLFQFHKKQSEYDELFHKALMGDRNLFLIYI